MQTLQDIFDLINRGRIINWMITGLYFVVLAVALERLLYFFRTRARTGPLSKLLASLTGTFSESLTPMECLRSTNPSSTQGSLLAHYLENRGETPALFREKIEERALVLSHTSRLRLWLLSEIGTIAPLMGLLGTVTGLILAFQTITIQGGDVDVLDLSGGIWESLLTTANGLIVALPALVFYRLLEGLAAKREHEMTVLVSRLDQYYGVLPEKRSEIIRKATSGGGWGS